MGSGVVVTLGSQAGKLMGSTHGILRTGETKGSVCQCRRFAVVCVVSSFFFDTRFLSRERGNDGSGFTCRSRVSRVDETMRWGSNSSLSLSSCNTSR